MLLMSTSLFEKQKSLFVNHLPLPFKVGLSPSERKIFLFASMIAPQK